MFNKKLLKKQIILTLSVFLLLGGALTLGAAKSKAQNRCPSFCSPDHPLYNCNHIACLSCNFCPTPTPTPPYCRDGCSPDHPVLNCNFELCQGCDFCQPNPTNTPVPNPTNTPRPNPSTYSCSNNGEKRCWANAVLNECIGGQWVITNNCLESDKICKNNSCQSAPKECQMGDRQCLGNNVVICQFDGSWNIQNNCHSDQLCISNPQKGPTCVDVPAQCKTDETTCLGNVFVSCPTRYWKVKERCGAGTCNPNSGCSAPSNPTNTPVPQPVCPADFNQNGDIDLEDLQVFIDDAKKDCSLE